MEKPISFLFLCLGNICRSPMAHYLAQDMFGEKAICDSAGMYGDVGMNATRDAQKAMKKEFGIDISQHIAKHLITLDPLEFDVVVCLDENVYRRLKNKVPAEKLLDWHVEDPYSFDYSVYVECLHEIRAKLVDFKEKNML